MPSPESPEKFSSLLRFAKSNGARLTAAAIAVHLAFVLPLAVRLNIWLDEAWTLETTANGVAAAWRAAVVKEHQAPLYFAFLAGWRELNDSLLFARLFSIVCIIATVALVPALVRRFAPASGKLPVALAFIVALHPYSVWASLEARVYAPVVLLSALLLLFWFDGYAEPKNRWRWARIFYVLLAVVSLYTNYYLGFALFANACALIAIGRWRTVVVYVAQMAAVGLLFLPLVFSIKQQFATNADYYREPTVFIDGVRVVWDTSVYFLLPSAEWEAMAFLRVWSARIGLLALLFFAVRRSRQISETTRALGVIVGVIGLFLMTAFFLLGSEYIQLRHCAPLFIPLLLFFSVLSANITKRNGLYVWLILLLIFLPTRLFSDYSPAKNGDWTRVADFIEQNEAENQPIATFQIHDSIPLNYAYDGKNEILRADSLDDWAAEDKPLSAARWRRQIKVLIELVPSDNSYLWLVTESYCFDEGEAVECRPLEEFVEANYTVEKSADFYRRRVRLLKRK